MANSDKLKWRWAFTLAAVAEAALVATFVLRSPMAAADVRDLALAMLAPGLIALPVPALFLMVNYRNGEWTDPDVIGGLARFHYRLCPFLVLFAAALVVTGLAGLGVAWLAEATA